MARFLDAMWYEREKRRSLCNEALYSFLTRGNTTIDAAGLCAYFPFPFEASVSLMSAGTEA